MSNISALVKLSIKQISILTDILVFLQKAELNGLNETPAEEVWLDRQQVWEKYHLGPKTLRRRTKEGIIPDSRIKGKLYYKESDILAALRLGYLDA